MPLQFLDHDPEPQPAEANAKTFHLIQDLHKSMTEAQANAVLPMTVIRATCEVSQGMVTPKDGIFLYASSHQVELGPLAVEAFELRSFEKLRKTGS